MSAAEPVIPSRGPELSLQSNPLLKSRMKKGKKKKKKGGGSAEVIRSNVVFKGRITGESLGAPIGVRGRLWLVENTLHGEYSTQKSDGSWWKEPYQLRGTIRDVVDAVAAAPSGGDTDAAAGEEAGEEAAPAVAPEAEAESGVDEGAGEAPASEAEAPPAEAESAAPADKKKPPPPPGAPPKPPPPLASDPPTAPPRIAKPRMLTGRVKSINEAGDVLSTLVCTFPENLCGELSFTGQNANGAVRKWDIVAQRAEWKVAPKPRIFYFDVKGAKVNRVSRQPGKFYACLNFMGIQRGTSNVKKAPTVRWDSPNVSDDPDSELHHKFVFKVPNVETCPDLILNIALYKTKPIQMQADKMIGSFRLKFSKAMVVNQLVDRWYQLTEKPSKEKVGQMQLAVVVVDANEVDLPGQPTEALVIDKIESQFLRSYGVGTSDASVAGKEASKLPKPSGVLSALTGAHGELYGGAAKKKSGGRGSATGAAAGGASSLDGGHDNKQPQKSAAEPSDAAESSGAGKKKKKRVLGRVANKRAKEEAAAKAEAEADAARERERIAREGEAFVNPLDAYDFGAVMAAAGEGEGDVATDLPASAEAEAPKALGKKASWMKHRAKPAGAAAGDDPEAAAIKSRRASAAASKRSERSECWRAASLRARALSCAVAEKPSDSHLSSPPPPPPPPPPSPHRSGAPPSRKSGRRLCVLAVLLETHSYCLLEASCVCIIPV